MSQGIQRQEIFRKRDFRKKVFRKRKRRDKDRLMKKKSSDSVKYTFGGNLAFMLRKAWQLDKSLMMVTVLQMPVLVLLPLCTTYLSSYMVK